ncbi:hypothetical protein J7T55_010516 [Diaporthe amygdali]|uniref:uncharacterized protein n=1 Tax=Phomopsis amygdali TaxID=1214568 RepID=UPI0022FDE3B3|nr:uncharacterized protein J7T55_010516 [Diaporthe amygdali]KAJ0115693.1 hypothetical protein J7T55_010516 [Diaporthe amygdali]
MKRQPDQKNGKVFQFRDSSEWNESERVAVRITSSQNQPSIDANLFIPIAPSPKNRIINMQLKFAGLGVPCGGLTQRGFHNLSYVRVEKVYEVPMSVLEPFQWGEKHNSA